MNTVKKLIVVDDHKIIRDGIKAMLIGNKEFSIVADVASGKELFKVVDSLNPDIVILDIGLPDMDGVQITSKLTQKYPLIKVLILSANTTEDYIISAIKAGAKGFLSKESSREEFIKALNSVSRDEAYYGESVSKIIYNSYISIVSGNKSSNADNQLSEREMDVLKAFSEGLSFKEIADKLSISPRTVESHKTNILQKLDLKNIVEMVKYAIKEGIVKL